MDSRQGDFEKTLLIDRLDSIEVYRERNTHLRLEGPVRNTHFVVRPPLPLLPGTTYSRNLEYRIVDDDMDIVLPETCQFRPND